MSSRIHNFRIFAKSQQKPAVAPKAVAKPVEAKKEIKFTKAAKAVEAEPVKEENKKED